MHKAVLFCATRDRKRLSSVVHRLGARAGERKEIDLRIAALEEGADGLTPPLDAIVVCLDGESAVERRSEVRAVLRAARSVCPDTTRVLVSEPQLGDVDPASAKEWLLLLRDGDVHRVLDGPGALEEAFARNEAAAREGGAEREPSGGLANRTRQLETLGELGVTLASSFDIQAILRETRRAAVDLLGGAESRVDVFYAGHDAIHSKPRWAPGVPDDGGLGTAERAGVERRVARRTPPEREANDGTWLLAPSDARAVVPIAHRDTLLGALFLSTQVELTKERAGLLALLSLQAATALGNIHLTQERIHFERLSIIGKMIGSVVHDLRGPLTAARGYAGMLSKSGLDDGDRRTYGRYLLEECDRLNDMVQELLDFSRGGGAEPSLSWVAAAEYLSHLAGRLTARFGPAVEVSVESSFDGEILVDSRRLERALWNLATNAAQAMPEGGRLVLRSRRREESVVIEVEDEGAGIPESIRHRVFEPFFSFGKAEGVGLGMATAKRIVEDHGGRLVVETDRGRGTLVRIFLPTESQGQARARMASPLTAAAENAR